LATSEIQENRTSETRSLGRLTQARARRAIERPYEVELWCLDYVGTIVKDTEGRPISFRTRCKNRECCSPKRDMIAIHVWDIVTGEFSTEYLPAIRGR
jgi:hypothetical protein